MAEQAFSYRVQLGETGALSETGLRAHQLDKLNQTLLWARQHCAFYRTRLPAEPLNSLDAIHTLPLMDESTFEQGLAPFVGVSQDEINRIVSVPTSGTTGNPKRIAFTQDEQANIVEYLASGMRMLARPGETIAVLFPTEHTGGLGHLICKGIALAGARVCACGLPTRELGFSHLAKTCRDQQVCGLVGFPQHIYAFAVWSRYNNIALPVQNVLLSADNVAPHLKQRIQQCWDAEVYAHYGTTEMGYGGAVECCCHQGMHIRETDLLFEIINPATGRVLPAGQWGELVFTTLNRRAMPLIRYRTGDMSCLLSGACECGSPLQRIGLVKGRGNTRLPFTLFDVENAIFAYDDILDFSLCWNPHERMLTLKLQMLPKGQTDFTAMEQELSECIGISVAIQHSTANEFEPLYSGKRHIVSESPASYSQA